MQGKENARVATQAEQVGERNAEKVATFQREKSNFGNRLADGLDSGEFAGAEAGAEETAEEVAEGVAEEGAELAGFEAVETTIATQPELWPVDALLGAGFGIFTLGQAFHWWGGGDKKAENLGPTPKPPTPPKLEDIPTPKTIQVGGPVMTSAKYHQNTAPAGVINSSILRR